MRGTIQKIEENFAHVLLVDGQVLHVPLSELPTNVRASSLVDVRIDMARPQEADAADASRLKLNEILSSTPE